jgi:hypothetical protein
VGALRGVGAIQDRADLVTGLVLVASNVELHERGVLVLRNLASMDVLDDRELRDAGDDVGDRRVEGGIAGSERAALDHDALTSGLLEAVVEDPVHSTRLAGPGRVRIDGLRAHRAADRERDGDEREPTEGRGLPVSGAPATHASREVVRLTAVLRTEHDASPFSRRHAA